MLRGMVRTDTQTEKAEETRRRIVRAAAELFGAHGYRGTSLTDVIDAAGSTKGGFYFHFRSKADLGLAVVAETREQFRADVLAATGEQIRGSDQIVAMVRAIAAACRAKPAASHIGRLCMELREEPEIAPSDLEMHGLWVLIVRDLLERAQREGDLDPGVDTLAAATYAVGAYVGVEALMADSPELLYDRIDDHLRITCRAIGGLRSTLLDP